ncbi:phage tail tape measure protein [Hafnia paralvei]|uniref:phage tail tape measure protein n=1 Tax=Hafnia paralvei TaxID=546367 RepID=UPI0039AF13FA
MSDEIGKISLVADTSSLERAANELDKFSASSNKAATAADSLNDSNAQTSAKVKDVNAAFAAGAAVREQTRRSYEGTTKELQGLQRELVAIRGRVDPVGVAFDNLAAMSDKLREGLRQKLIDPSDYAASVKGIDNLTSALERSVYESSAAGKAAKEAAQADKVATVAKESFISRLREQAETQGKTNSEIMAYRAAQLGATKEAAPFIASLKQQEDAWKKGTISAGQYRQAMRQLPAQITDVVTSLASGMPVYMVAIQQGGQIKDSFGGIGNAAKAMLSFLNPTNVALGITAAVFGSVAIAAYKSRQEIAEANKEVHSNIGITGEYAEKLALNIRNIANASESSIKSISEMFIATKDGAEESTQKLIAVGFSYQEAKRRVDEYKDSSDFTSLNSDIETHKLNVLGLKDAWSDAAKEVRDYYTGISAGKQSVALGGAIDPLVKVLESAKQLNGDIISQSIKINQEVRERVSWVNKEYLASDRVAGAQDRLKKAVEARNKIANSGDNDAISNANKLVAIRQKELESAQKKGVDKPHAKKSVSDDAATKELAASQQRLAVLRGQSSITDKMTQQESRLLEFNQQIADLKSKSILTADQKSLLSRESEIRASLQLEANIAKENAQRDKAVKAMKTMSDYAKEIEERNQQARNSFGQTTKGTQREAQESQLKKTYNKSLEGITDPAQLEKITAEYVRARDKLHEGFRDEDARESDWISGLNMGINQFAENSLNVFQATAQIGQTTMQSLSDMATDLASTGKANIKEFGTSILKMILQVINQLLVAYAIQSALGWMSGGASFSSTGLNDGTKGIPMPPKFDAGGYTGDGGKYEPKGIVHGGEFVFTKESTSRIGTDNLYALMRGYANGGLVGGASTGRAPMLGLQGGGSASGPIIQTSVVVNNEGGQQQQGGNSDVLGKAYQQVIDTSVRDGISKALRPGGLIWMAQNKR